MADGPVHTHQGAGRRPVITVRCRRGKAEVSLDPGVDAVETVVLENGSMAQLSRVVVTAPSRGTHDALWKGQPGGALQLPKRDMGWFRSLERVQGEVTMAYTPFASEGAVASFQWTGFAEAVAPYRSVCGLG
jgi:hypothetical protein